MQTFLSTLQVPVSNVTKTEFFSVRDAPNHQPAQNSRQNKLPERLHKKHGMINLIDVVGETVWRTKHLPIITNHL